MNWIDHRSVQEPNICQCIVHNCSGTHAHTDCEPINAEEIHSAQDDGKNAKPFRMAFVLRSAIEFNLPVWPEIMESVCVCVPKYYRYRVHRQNWFTNSAKRRKHTLKINSSSTHECDRRVVVDKNKSCTSPYRFCPPDTPLADAKAIYACQHHGTRRCFYVVAEGKNEKLNCIIKRFNIPRKTQCRFIQLTELRRPRSLRHFMRIQRRNGWQRRMPFTGRSYAHDFLVSTTQHYYFPRKCEWQ